MKQRPTYLAAYDISEQRRRTAARRLLRGYALDGQKSVFECPLDLSERACLLSAVDPLIETEQDRFLLVRLDGHGETQGLGLARTTQDATCFYLG